ncbi:MAG: hypothetical protein RJA78_997 [Actinomycetota bacterium]
MGLKFIDPATGEVTGSTALGRAVLEKAVEAENQNLATDISNQQNWRKSYQSHFAQVAKSELHSKRSAIKIATSGLLEFEQRIATDSGQLLIDSVMNAWRLTRGKVETVVIKGTNTADKPAIDILDVKEMVAKHSAEPGIIDAVELVNDLDPSAIKTDLLIALAGGAEYSPTRLWLDWGGDVAIVARARPELWRELIARARSGSGSLYVPVLIEKLPAGKNPSSLNDEELASVAGLDLTKNYEEISSWVASLAKSDSRRIVLGCYAYAPGLEHIQVQAVQHCLARAATEALPKSRIVLSWLATPTDSHVLPVEFADDIAARYQSRTAWTKFRDFLFRAHEHLPERFESAEGTKYALIDPTSSLQGSSYALAKRLQRWLAYQQVEAGRQVSYLVAPPARTESVLSHRILRATYKGAPHFGLHPFDTDLAVRISAILLLAKLQRPVMTEKHDFTRLYCELAVHGGLWRSIYRPSDLWRVATIRGFWGYFSKR